MTASALDKVITVLHKTNDGDLLAPRHLVLVEAIANSGVFDVSEATEVAFEKLHADVVAGRYDKDRVWLWGIEHLTKNHLGYVYWKGVEVEHFSFSDLQGERAAATKLAEVCLSLEAKGFPVNGRSVLDRRIQDAPADTPWLTLLFKLTAVFYRGDEVDWLILENGFNGAVAVSKAPNGFLQMRYFASKVGESASHVAIHALQREAAVIGRLGSCSYGELVRKVERAGFTPDDIDFALA